MIKKHIADSLGTMHANGLYLENLR